MLFKFIILKIILISQWQLALSQDSFSLLGKGREGKRKGT